MKSIKIAAAQGFWGDYNDAALRQIQGGSINYLIFDYLAELTMSILSKQKSKNSDLGYAKDFPKVIESIAKLLVEKKVKVIANAGGVNPKGCAKEILGILEKLNLKDKLKVGIVYGDDICAKVPELISRGNKFINMDTNIELDINSQQVVSANAYLGSSQIVAALSKGADIVITGRVADAAMPLAAMQYEFNWKNTDYDKLALGIVAGHIIECGAQASGGNCSLDWENIPDLWNVGFPIIEAYEDGRTYITKHPGTGGKVSLASVKEQLVYEIGDPKNYITPDVIADFTSVELAEVEENKVELKNIKGNPPTDSYKVSLAYFNGYKADGTLIYTWPKALEKAKAAADIVQKRLKDKGFDFEEFYTEFIGQNSCHLEVFDKEKKSEPLEILLRLAARSKDFKAVEALTRELVPLVLAGPPGASGYTGSRSKVQEVYSYWPCLLNKKEIIENMEIL